MRKSVLKKSVLKKAVKLSILVCVEEIEAVCKAASFPMTRKQWLTGRGFHSFMRERLDKLKYDGKVKRYPKHKPKPEDVQVVKEGED